MRALGLAPLLALALAWPACAEEKAIASVFLVSRHDMPDPNFHDSVIVVARHGGGGPVGLIVNKPTTIPLSRVFPDVEALRGRGDMLFLGGPVSRQQLFVVFRAASAPEDAIELVEGVYMSMSVEVMRELAASGAAPDRFRVFAGYAGWAPSQLEAEVGRGDWHVAKPDAATIFAAKPAEVWRELFRRASAVEARYLDFLQRYQPTTLSPMKSVSMSASSPSFERFTSWGSWSNARASTSSGSWPTLVTLPVSVSMDTSSRSRREDCSSRSTRRREARRSASAFTALMMEASMSASPPTIVPVAGSTSSRMPFETRAATIASP
jgi:putative transcriptional regulator